MPRPFTRALKLDWARSLLSSAQVQRYASAGSEQGMYGVEDLAKIGNFGNNPSGMHSQLLRLFGHESFASSITWFDIPCRSGVKPHPFLMPHTFFLKLFGEPHKFQNYILGATSEETRRSYWRGMAGTAFATNHPHLDRARWHFTILVVLVAGGWKHEGRGTGSAFPSAHSHSEI